MRNSILGIAMVAVLEVAGVTADPVSAESPKNSCTVANPNSFQQTLSDMTTALTAIRRGDPKPYTAKWSNADDVTLFGAWGTIEQGHQRLAETFQWVASRFSSEGESTQDIRTIHMSGDLAVTVGFERGPARVDGGQPKEMVIRVTHVYRCEKGNWQLVHRHADYPPADPRKINKKE